MAVRTWEDYRVGDKFTGTVTVTRKDRHGVPDFEVDLDSLELAEKGPTPGQRAYEASFTDDEMHVTWKHLPGTTHAKWERIAAAAQDS